MTGIPHEYQIDMQGNNIEDVACIIPSASGTSHLGIDGSGVGAFSISSLRPFNHVHQVSGVFHDPLLGQSGVLRFSYAARAFEVSYDGGLTFVRLNTGSGLNAINGDTGPNIDFVGVNGLIFRNPSAGVILGDVAALSGIILTAAITSVNAETGPAITIVGENLSVASSFSAVAKGQFEQSSEGRRFSREEERRITPGQRDQS